MQTTGYITIRKEKILVLCRQRKYSRQFKIRESGKSGTHFLDEGVFLENEPEKLAQLKAGIVIEC